MLLLAVRHAYRLVYCRPLPWDELQLQGIYLNSRKTSSVKKNKTSPSLKKTSLGSRMLDLIEPSKERKFYSFLTFIGPCVAVIFAQYGQHDATFHNCFISVRRSKCFRRFFRRSSGTQNCTYSVKYLSDWYLTLYVQFWAPDDGRKNLLKHLERLTEIKQLWNGACWSYFAQILFINYWKTAHASHWLGITEDYFICRKNLSPYKNLWIHWIIREYNSPTSMNCYWLKVNEL